MAKTNVTKVQVPGEAAAPADDQSTPLEQGAAGDDAGQDGNQIQTADDPAAGADDLSSENSALQAQLAAKDAELAQLKAALAKSDAGVIVGPGVTTAALQAQMSAKKAEALRPGPGGRSDFTHLRASQIDVATLKRPIETRDGWLVPEKITQNDKG